MGKFVIEKIIIDKSDKDIKTGIEYNLKNDFNIIYGKNEAGKTSLMQFLKEGFFQKKADVGKIFFSIDKNGEKEIYKAEIKNTTKKQDRCKIFDEKNNPCAYSIITDNVKELEYTQGFTINLDDLSKINKSQDYLINAIKDPSGDKLKQHTEEIKNNIDNIVSSNKKSLKKDVETIYKNINELSNKIQERYYDETNYNNALKVIELAKENIKSLKEEYSYLNNLKQIRSLEEKLDKLSSELQLKLSLFNKALFENNQGFNDLQQKAGEYGANIENLNNKKQELNKLSEVILDNQKLLMTNYDISINEENIDKIAINPKINVEIKELQENISSEKQDIKHLEENLKTSQEEIKNIAKKIENLQNEEILNLDIEKIKNDNEALKIHIETYDLLMNERGRIEEKSIITQPQNNKSLILILVFAMLICGLTIGVYSFLTKNYIILTASVFLIAFAIVGLININSKKQNASKNKELEDFKFKVENILNDLRNDIKDYYDNYAKIEKFQMITTCKNLQNKLEKQINEYNQKKIELDEKLNKQNELHNKTKTYEEKIEVSNKNINNNSKQIEELIESISSDITLFPKTLDEVISIIKDLKTDFKKLETLKQEISDLETSQNNIWTQLKEFIYQNSIKIEFSDDFKNNISNLTIYNNSNNDLKNEIEHIEFQINDTKNIINDLENMNLKIKEKFNIQESELEIEERLEIIDTKIKDEETVKDKANQEMGSIERLEDINELKLKKSQLINQYRNYIKNLFVNQMANYIIAEAKCEFEKTQPDLINAEKYLSILTNGKYSKINLDFQTIGNEDWSISKEWDTLSRGTTEQLYLALRLGYASNYSIDKITKENNGLPNLPLIIDDVFTNFDTERTIQALKCLLEFSKTNQVLFFTCHPEETKRLLGEIKITKEINEIEL